MYVPLGCIFSYPFCRPKSLLNGPCIISFLVNNKSFSEVPSPHPKRSKRHLNPVSPCHGCWSTIKSWACQKPPRRMKFAAPTEARVELIPKRKDRTTDPEPSVFYRCTIIWLLVVMCSISLSESLSSDSMSLSSAGDSPHTIHHRIIAVKLRQCKIIACNKLEPGTPCKWYIMHPRFTSKIRLTHSREPFS